MKEEMKGEKYTEDMKSIHKRNLNDHIGKERD